MKKDVIIIGGGIIGCSIARELSKYNLDIALIEKESDIACGISKANSGIIHAGFNEKKNTLKSKLTVLGNELYDSLSKDLDFTIKRNGALVLAFNKEEEEKLKELKENGESLKVPSLSLLSKEEIQALEKNISKAATLALYAKTSAVINPYEVTIALGENASENGVEFLLNSKVKAIAKADNSYFVTLENGDTLEGSIVINSTGLFGDEINNLINPKKYTQIPVKGEYILLDKIAGAIVDKTIFTVPTKTSKGILVTKTVDGNLLVGPTAKYALNNEDLKTSKTTLNEIIEKSNNSVENIQFNRTLTTFSGLRPKTLEDDFIIDEVDGFISLVSIDSPGLTAAPAIALYVKELVSNKIKLTEKDNFINRRKRIKKFSELTLDDKNSLIKENPLYGKMICKCELITEGEIVEAIKRPLGARTVDGVKRRTRATMGGCQGVGCLLPISKIISRELNIPLIEVMKNSTCSNAIGFGGK
ncbi:MAG: NAD(P)/FAD-dependent oxidoreductase [Clostridium sp.]